MVQTLSRVIAALALAIVVLAGCKFEETHATCRSSADCSAGLQCYLSYCVSGDAGAGQAPPASASSEQPATASMPQGAPTETASCGPSSPLAAREGECCVAPSSCYEGPAETLDIGACKAGTRTCEAGKLSACADSVLPREESCTNPGSDDDCDGTVDELTGRGERCELMSGFGTCGTGVLDCEPGMDKLSCVRVGPPVDESCNYQDDDCDGQIDEGFDISSDRMNCGTCGQTCASDQLCCAGTCLAMASASESGCPMCSTAQPCAEADSCCGGACRDLERDRRHCGSCGHSCEQAQICCGGICQASCDS